MKILLAGDPGSPHFYRWNKLLQSLGYDVSILSYLDRKRFNGNFKYEQQKYYNFKKYLKSNGRSWLVWVDIIGYVFASIFIDRGRYDLINFHYFSATWAIIGLFLRTPFIFTMWGSDINIYYSSAKGIKKKVLDLALKRASAITCDSNTVKRELLKNCHGINEKKIKIIYWGIDTTQFYQRSYIYRLEVRKKYNIDEKAIVLLSIRGMKPFYRNLEIIKWFKDNIKGDNYILFIHYNSNYEYIDYIHNCKITAGNDKRIIFDTTLLTNEEMPDIYNISDISLNFPVIDATPVSMLESIACKNIVICDSNIESYKELSIKFDLFLTKLENLEEKNILDLIKIKELIVNSNFDMVNKEFSQATTLHAIKELFDYCKRNLARSYKI